MATIAENRTLGENAVFGFNISNKNETLREIGHGLKLFIRSSYCSLRTILQNLIIVFINIQLQKIFSSETTGPN